MHFNKILTIIVLGVVCASQAAIIRSPPNQQQNTSDKKPWDLIEAIVAPSKIRGFNGTWISDNEFYYIAADKSIRKYNAESQHDYILVDSYFLRIYNTISSFKLSPDSTKILVRYDVEGLFRHSFIAKFDVFDIATQKSYKIHNGEKLQHCEWSPIKDRLAYVYNNNVFIHYGENSEIKITFDGINGVFYNGIPDWVYEEEVLSSGSAMWWSNDGNFLAVGVFNDTNVETFKYFVYGEAEDLHFQYPKELDLKYPKPGTNNPVVSLRVFDLRTEPYYVPIKAPVDVVSHDHILQNVGWTSDGRLLITWLNRRQNIASLQLCNTLGACREINRIKEPKGWVQIGNPSCLKHSQNCLFTYWIGNWYQLWNLDLKTGKNIWNSRGNFTVLKLYGYDEFNHKVYYQATLDSDPSVIHVFSNSDCLTCGLTDIEDAKCLSASASFSKDFSYYTIVCNGPDPSFTKIFKTDPKGEVKNWDYNIDFRIELSKKLRPKIDVMKVKLSDGSFGMANIQYPPNLDVKKSYPMIVSVYGGPNFVKVTNSFGLGLDAYMTTNREVIYVQIDGRGSGNKGKDLLFSVNNHLGEFEVEDQLYVTKYLQKLLPYVDKNRCGLWGWSYGGYMTARILANDTDRVFQCGISVAPVTSWLYYDSIYTERYMDLPDNNMEKYLNTSVLQQVDNFRNHDFMLIHGSGDENVHYQQSLMFAKVLQANDIMFEQVTYTDETHSIRNVYPHLYHTMDNFWTNCLNLDVGEDD